MKAKYQIDTFIDSRGYTFQTHKFQLKGRMIVFKDIEDGKLHAIAQTDDTQITEI